MRTKLLLLFCLAGVIAFADTHAFPTVSSTVVGSSGFISSNEIGYFWSVSRGDLVSQTFTDPLASISSLTLNLSVPHNSLRYDALNWAVWVNNTQVGVFDVNVGFIGTLVKYYLFSPIAANNGTYDLSLRVTNQIRDLEGSHTFGLAGSRVTFGPVPTSVPEPGQAVIISSAVAGVLFRMRRHRRTAA